MLIRFLFLFYYASLGSLLPYLPVYYHSIGHGGQIIGLLGAVKPFTTFLVAPLWGVIADQSEKPFFILQVTFLVSLVGQLAVAFRADALYSTFLVGNTRMCLAKLATLYLDELTLPNENSIVPLTHSHIYGVLDSLVQRPRQILIRFHGDGSFD